MYINLLTQLQNAQMVGKEKIKFPYSRMDENNLTLLEQKRLIKSAEKKGKNPKKYFDIVLRYTKGDGAIKGFSFVSKPSRRVYAGYQDIYPVKQGHGLSVLSTSEGIMTGVDAKKKKVGGEVLFTIW